MTITTYPSPIWAHRRADLLVHLVGLCFILVGGGILISKTSGELEPRLALTVVVYVLCALASNLSSCAYHFAPWHSRRQIFRRIDHAAIYLAISGSFSPFFVQAGTMWTFTLFWITWSLTLLAIWNKLTNPNVKSSWSTASYLGLGAIGLGAIPDLTDVPSGSVWCILIGASCYVIGTFFYTRRSIPFRFAIWHTWGNLGGMFMFAAIWIALI